jgi:hypothetical protein
VCSLQRVLMATYMLMDIDIGLAVTKLAFFKSNDKR